MCSSSSTTHPPTQNSQKITQIGRITLRVGKSLGLQKMVLTKPRTWNSEKSKKQKGEEKKSYAWASVSDSRKWSSQPYPVSSSSGPTRKTAPASLASRNDCLVRAKFPSKSMAHWLRLQVATFTSLIVPHAQRTTPGRGLLLLPLLRSPSLAIRAVPRGLWNKTPNSQTKVPRGTVWVQMCVREE